MGQLDDMVKMASVPLDKKDRQAFLAYTQDEA